MLGAELCGQFGTVLNNIPALMYHIDQHPAMKQGAELCGQFEIVLNNIPAFM